MKKIILCVLLCLLAMSAQAQDCGSNVCLAKMNPYIAGSGVVSVATSCTQSNDSAIVDHGVTTDASDWTTLMRAFKFTIAAPVSITGYYFQCSDGGDTAARTTTMYLYSHNSGADEPNTSLGADYQASLTDLTDASGLNYYMLSSTQTLSAGTYWVVWSSLGVTGTISFDYVAGSSGNTKRNPDGGATWYSSSWDNKVGVMGCD